MTRVGLLLASLVLYLGCPEVHGGKIFFPDSSAAEDVPEEPSEPQPREERGLWESDLFFLQKLSGLFDVGQEQQQQQQQKRRYRLPSHSSLRPELLPPQMLFPKRRGDTNNPVHLNQVGVRKIPRVPVRPSPHFSSPHQNPQSFGSLRPNIQGVKPIHQNVLVIPPSTQDVPPPPDAFAQPSQNHPISIRPPPPPPPPPAPPKPSSSIVPVQPASNFPYQFVRPGSHLSANSIRTHHTHQATVPQPLDTSRPSFPRVTSLRPVSSHPLTSRPPPIKPSKTKKPTLVGSWPSLAPGRGVFSNTHRPQKHPRPAPQPQRVFIHPHIKPPPKKDFKSNLDFKPSPQEGKSVDDAFQPVFVASPFMDDLGEDVMKPMIVASLRSFAVTTTTTQPELQDFF